MTVVMGDQAQKISGEFETKDNGYNQRNNSRQEIIEKLQVS